MDKMHSTQTFRSSFPQPQRPGPCVCVAMLWMSSVRWPQAGRSDCAYRANQSAFATSAALVSASTPAKPILRKAQSFASKTVIWVGNSGGETANVNSDSLHDVVITCSLLSLIGGRAKSSTLPHRSLPWLRNPAPEIPETPRRSPTDLGGAPEPAAAHNPDRDVGMIHPILHRGIMQQSQGIGQGMQKQKRPGQQPPRSPPRRFVSVSGCGRWGSAWRVSGRSGSEVRMSQATSGQITYPLAGMLGAASFAERAAGPAEAAGDSRSAIAVAMATLCECGFGAEGVACKTMQEEEKLKLSEECGVVRRSKTAARGLCQVRWVCWVQLQHKWRSTVTSSGSTLTPVG